MREVLINDLMTTGVQCSAPATHLSEVVRSMQTNRHSCMVITENSMPVGIITERDIVMRFSELMQAGSNYDPPAARIMSSPAVTVSAQASLMDALVVAKSNEIRHLPVTNREGRLVGLVTQTDLVRAHFRVVEAQIGVVDRAVADRTQVLMEANMKLKELMLEDPLLGIGNRRAMEVDLAHTLEAARRYHRPCAVILCDLDNFKLYNDHYGHPAGDKALQESVTVIKQVLRKSDRAYRYGGEELLLLLPETTREGAEELAQRLLAAVVNLGIPHVCHPLGILTFSGGISCVGEVDVKESWKDLVRRADWALYRAKSAGRNRVVSFAKIEPLNQPTSENVLEFRDILEIGGDPKNPHPDAV
ncbi:MAG: GGDEF domain-containing protein [Deltaproteobacteria bacterium]|nr:GGDEF domain-containing protein [Deltaproteobacteria bacterium]